jgi:hypothetical protein
VHGATVDGGGFRGQAGVYFEKTQLQMKKAPFDRRFDEILNSRTITQIGPFVKAGSRIGSSQSKERRSYTGMIARTCQGRLN